MKIILNLLLVISTIFILACGDKEGATVSPPPTGTCSEFLSQVTTTPIGVAINVDALRDDVEYQKLVKEHFNSITPENIMKPINIHPEKDVFNWGPSDSLVEYCIKNNIKVHGHTLIWHNQLPDWMVNFQGSKAEWEDMMKEHIREIVLRYKGKVRGWDVVNEAFEEDGSLRNNIWLQNIGETYIEKAFLYAHNADPNALLFYNDFNLEFNPAKREKVIQFLNTVRNRGVTVHGIGLQSHIYHTYPSELLIKESFDDVVKNNYQIHVSELDVSVNPFSVDIELTNELLEQQAKQYETVARLFKNLPVDKKYGLTIWGVSDNYSWIPTFFLREDYPLLFDDMYQKKPAFFRLKSTLCNY